MTHPYSSFGNPTKISCYILQRFRKCNVLIAQPKIHTIENETKNSPFAIINTWLTRMWQLKKNYWLPGFIASRFSSGFIGLWLSGFISFFFFLSTTIKVLLCLSSLQAHYLDILFLLHSDEQHMLILCLMTLSERYRMDGLDDSMSEDVGCGSVMMSL